MGLESLEQEFPDIAKVGSIGESVEGKPLVYIKLSANVEERSLLEPMVKYVGNMHGNEAVSRQMLIYLAEYLAIGYHSDRRIGLLLNRTEIFILPTLNPDGFATSKEGTCNGTVGRNNANNVDLNRSFPAQFVPEQPKDLKMLNETHEREPEALAAMDWIIDNPFVLSANLHGGAVVASYSFDESAKHILQGFYSASPDDETFVYLATRYATSHAKMSTANIDCDGGQNFTGGVTNGAQWYDVPGGMQDFNYLHSNALEITVELTCCKKPQAAKLAGHWRDNKEALIAYLEEVHTGVKGQVMNKGVGGAEVEVEGISRNLVATEKGEYWKVLAPGKYRIRAVEQRPKAKATGKWVTVRVEQGQSQTLNLSL